ncbi:MAG: amino acid ABC transporter permease [Bosea sp. (in: a-proteobacteria)]
MTTSSSVAFVRSETLQPSPAPSSTRGPIHWIRENLLSSPTNIILTLIGLYLVYITVPEMFRFYFWDAVWTGKDRDACLADKVGRPVGACWAYIADRWQYFIYGSYPIAERWRINITFVMFALGVVWLLWDKLPQKKAAGFYFFLVLPVIGFILLRGSPMFGLVKVDTGLWGGMTVSLLIAAVGIVFSLPLGILLALGRRSKLPIIRVLSVVFIEFVRGVPLITVLFMANTMLPLFVPQEYSPDRLLRPLVGVALFAAAYMAEVIRGGLQAMPKGQYEGAQSLGLGYGKMMRLIILPQALRIVIPGIVNTFIGLFKDTTLVAIVGIFDFLRTIEATLVDPTWATPTTRATGYAFAAIFYFLCCWGMSRYSISVENRLAAGQKR